MIMMPLGLGLPLQIVGLIIFIVTAGAFANEDEVWKLSCDISKYVSRAVGANFSVTIISPCRNDALGCRIQYSIQEDGLPEEYVAERFTVEKDGSGGSIIQTYQEIGATISYSYKASNDNEIILNLLIVPENRSVVMNIYVISTMKCAPQTFQIGRVNLIGCQKDTDKIAVDPSVDIVRYRDVGNIVCDGYPKGRAIFTNGSEALETYCDSDATWKDIDNITCLYPVPGTVTIDGGQYNDSVILYYRHNASLDPKIILSCSSNSTYTATWTHGSPKFILADDDIPSPCLPINPSLNGKKIWCYLENNFTKYFDVKMAHSLASSLTVEFGPYPPPGRSALCSFTNGSVQFYSNPLSSQSSLSVIVTGAQGEKKIASKIEACCPVSYGVRGQMITLLIPVDEPQYWSEGVYSNFTLRSNASGMTVDYEVVPCDDVVLPISVTTGGTVGGTADVTVGGTAGVTTTPDAGSGAQPTPGFSKSSMTIVILTAVAGFLLIVLIGCLLWNRHLKAGLESM